MSFLFIGLVSLLANTLSFRSLPLESAGTNVQTVCQDSLGNMWFGGLDGITLYDGSRYAQFKHRANETDGIPDNRIYKLYCDTGGDIWVSHITGLSRYDRAKAGFHNYISPDGIVSDIVQLDGDRLLTVTGDRLWIFSRKEERFSREEIPAALQEVRVNTLFSDGESLYIGGRDGYIYLCSQDLHQVKALPWSAPLRINCLLLDTDGRLWAGTEGNGVLVYSPKDNTQIHYRSSSRPGSLSSDYVRSMCMDRAGVLWIGTKNGLNIYRNGNFEVYYHNYYDARSLPHNSVCDIYCDKQGSLWLGTFYGGVCYCTPNASRFFTLDSRPGAGYLNGSIISAIVETEDGSLWVGTNTGELNQLLPDGRFRHIRLPGEKPADQLDIKCLLISRRSGTLFVGADLGGLSYMRPHDGHLRPVREGQSLSIYGLEESDDGTLIVGASEGLFEYDEHSGTLSRAVTDRDYSKIKSLMLDDEGILWIGQKTGISALRWESRETLPLPKPLAAVRYVEDTMRDSQGRLWASTSGGLFCYNLRDSTLTSYTTREGLPDNVVHGVEEDSEGRLWVSTNNGLCRLNPADGDICIFTTADGLPGNRFTPYAHGKGRSGEMYFGGLNWLVRFHPEDVCPGRETMTPVLSGMEVNGNWRPVPPEAVRLKATERDVTLLFSIPDYISGQNGRFFYRMEGVDTDWHEAGMERKAVYHGLKPGSYSFQLRYQGSSGIVSPTHEALKLHIAPFWYETLTFRIALAFLFLMLIIAYFLWLLSRAKVEHQTEMEKFRNELLRDFSLEFVSMGARTSGEAPAAPVRNFGKDDEDFMRRAMQVVRSNIDNPEFSVENLAQEMFMSRSNLHLRIKALFGVSSLEFIKTVRINEACRLLHEKKYSMAEVGYMTGFATPSYFAAAFRKFMGCTPSEYVKRN